MAGLGAPGIPAVDYPAKDLDEEFGCDRHQRAVKVTVKPTLPCAPWMNARAADLTVVGELIRRCARGKPEPMSNFDADPTIQEIAEAYALDMVDYAKNEHEIELDWSDESVRQIERIAAVLHEEYRKDQPSSEQLAPFYKSLGSYVGEVYRRNHGAEWGWVTLEGDRFPGMQCKTGAFWPWGRALNRIVNGPKDDIWRYYQSLTTD